MAEATNKQDLRRALLIARDERPESVRQDLDRAILAHAARMKCFREAPLVLLYVPVGSEIDVTPLVRLAWEQGSEVGLPVCDPGTRSMVFRRFSRGDELEIGAHGIPEPSDSAPLAVPDERTVCFLPALAYDRELRRIGYGAGYYDRFLATFPGRAIGLAYRENLLPSVCAEPHDLAADRVITEDGVVRPESAENPSKSHTGVQIPGDSAAETASDARSDPASAYATGQNQNPGADPSSGGANWAEKPAKSHTRVQIPADSAAETASDARSDPASAHAVGQNRNPGADPSSGGANRAENPSKSHTGVQIPADSAAETASDARSDPASAHAAGQNRNPGADPSSGGANRAENPSKSHTGVQKTSFWEQKLRDWKLRERAAAALGAIRTLLKKGLSAAQSKGRALLRIIGSDRFTPSREMAFSIPLILSAAMLFVFLMRFPLLSLSRTPWLYPVAAVCLLAALFLPSVLFLRRHPIPPLTRLRLRRPRAECLPFCLFAAVSVTSGSFLFGILSGEVGSSSGSFILYHAIVARTATPWQILGAALVCAILPAICEELLFRGILIAVYEPAGVPAAVAISTLFGATLTASFRDLPGAILTGLLFAATLYATRSLIPPILLHILCNLFRVFYAPNLASFYLHAGSSDLFRFLVIGLFLLFSALAAGSARKLYHRYARHGLANRYAPYLPLREIPQRLWAVVRSVPFAVYAGIWLIAAIIGAFRGE